MPQKLNKRVRISLQELHQAPPLGPNRYYYISECLTNCSLRDCGINCESRTIPYGGQKEFYVRNYEGTIISKWAEKFYWDTTPNSFERLWINSDQRYHQFHIYTHFPEIPDGGWVDYKPEEEAKEARYRLTFKDYTKRQAQQRAAERRKIADSFRQKEEGFYRARNRRRD